jgi:hypothetical protein
MANYFKTFIKYLTTEASKIVTDEEYSNLEKNIREMAERMNSGGYNPSFVEKYYPIQTFEIIKRGKFKKIYTYEGWPEGKEAYSKCAYVIALINRKILYGMLLDHYVRPLYSEREDLPQYKPKNIYSGDGEDIMSRISEYDEEKIKEFSKDMVDGFNRTLLFRHSTNLIDHLSGFATGF